VKILKYPGAHCRDQSRPELIGLSNAISVNKSLGATSCFLLAFLFYLYDSNCAGNNLSEES
jgi:hypothetical protein